MIGVCEPLDVLHVHEVVQRDQVGLVVHVQHARLDVLNKGPVLVLLCVNVKR